MAWRGCPTMSLSKVEWHVPYKQVVRNASTELFLQHPFVDCGSHREPKLQVDRLTLRVPSEKQSRCTVQNAKPLIFWQNVNEYNYIFCWRKSDETVKRFLLLWSWIVSSKYAWQKYFSQFGQAGWTSRLLVTVPGHWLRMRSSRNNDLWWISETVGLRIVGGCANLFDVLYQFDYRHHYHYK